VTARFHSGGRAGAPPPNGAKFAAAWLAAAAQRGALAPAGRISARRKPQGVTARFHSGGRTGAGTEENGGTRWDAWNKWEYVDGTELALLNLGYLTYIIMLCACV
jgi:hypothetical protein